mmetsp:Transcript_9817/g.19123  ORF Transcript_9817/g.19123 Transcript_9817/m.19123 type:complete len:112 (+) Transcript_9817:138-473(+)
MYRSVHERSFSIIHEERRQSWSQLRQNSRRTIMLVAPPKTPAVCLTSFLSIPSADNLFRLCYNSFGQVPRESRGEHEDGGSQRAKSQGADTAAEERQFGAGAAESAAAPAQ